MKSIPLSLNKKVAVVTGGGAGIGEAMVKVFGRAGATVVILLADGGWVLE